MDFIKYSLEDESIRRFIAKLNYTEGIKIEIVGEIEELSQQEYRGKRVYIRLTDGDGNQINSKMDLGVHVNMDVEQEEYCFDICSDDEGANLFINSKEQMFTEKLRSLLRFGPLSTRFKDIFDMYYLSNLVDKEKLRKCIDIYIINAQEMREGSFSDIYNRVASTFDSRVYQNNIARARKSNWLNMDAKDAMNGLLCFMKNMSL